MRSIATYAFETKLDVSAAEQGFQNIGEMAKSWLRRKVASSDGTLQSGQITFVDGRICKLVVLAASTSVGRLCSWELTEPSNDYEFRTTLHFAQAGPSLVVFCTLEAGVIGTEVAPLSRIAARTPPQSCVKYWSSDFFGGWGRPRLLWGTSGW